MQVNLNSPLFSKFLRLLPWVLLCLVLWFKGCNRSEIPNSSVKVVTPEVVGKFKSKKPIQEPISIKTTKGETVFIKNPINQKLIAENEKLKIDFAKANDSIKKLSFYKAIELNKFSTKFEDDNLIVNIDGVVQGEVKEITPNYIIKKKTVDIPIKQKETVFRLLGGAGIGLDEATAKLAYKLDLGFQNRKGNIISIEFLKVSNQEYVMIGYKKSIFSIKR